MIKVLINGCNGKMGQVLANEITHTPDVEILCGVDKIDTGDNNFPVFTNVSEINLIPDVIIDFGKAAKTCGIGEMGLSGKIINKEYGPFMRYCFIITDAPLECDEPLTEKICDGCGECIKACPGKAISKDGLDSWQCAVYYRGAHKSNPFMDEKFLENNPEKQDILNGDKRFDSTSAREIFKDIRFLPNNSDNFIFIIALLL